MKKKSPKDKKDNFSLISSDAEWKMNLINSRA